MTHKARTPLRSLALCLVLSVIGLALTACGPRYNHHASNSAACAPAYHQACDSRGYQAGYYVIPTYHQYYVPSSVPAPSVPPAPTPLPAPVETYEPTPIIAAIDPPLPPISEWPKPRPFEPYPWQPEESCPEGTIRGYNGESCIQVTVLRK